MPDGSLGQDDIDRMLAELGADGGKPSEPAQPEAAKPQAAEAPSSDPPTAAATDAPAGALDQDAIDALIAQTAEVVADKPKTTVQTTSNGGGHLDQHEIDKLLAELDPQSRKQKAAGSASGHLDQNDIDRLLTELDVSSAGSASEVMPATAAAADSRAAKPAPPAPPVPEPVTAVPSTQPDAPVQPPAPKAVDGPLSQADIDKLLSELGAPSTKVGASKKTETAATDLAPRSTRTIPPAPQPVDAVPSKPSEATQELTAAEIDEIVSRHGDSAPPGSESEAVIAQSDIDALVKQLAQATGSPDAQEVADAIAGKAEDIDRLQAEMSPVSPEMTRDAVDVNSILGHTASTASLHAQPAMVMSNVTTVSVGDWWLARGLLVAAVLMLGVCSGVLIWLTMSVGSLSGELRAAREVEHPAVDGYADKLRLALAKLVEADESERARGVRWMEELKRQHPDRAADVGIALARHFRSRDAWRRAADEYGAALEVAGGVDDPHVLLEYADCLTRLGDSAGAIRQVYTLLASESTWLAERDHDGRSVAGVERNRQAVSDAYLMLGRLLARSRSGSAMATSEGPARAEPAPAHGGGH
jgi:hypothetical protein